MSKERCVCCKKELPETGDLLEVHYRNKVTGGVCPECLFTVNALRLFLVRDKDNTFALKEMQVLPSSNR